MASRGLHAQPRGICCQWYGGQDLGYYTSLCMKNNVLHSESSTIIRGWLDEDRLQTWHLLPCASQCRPKPTVADALDYISSLRSDAHSFIASVSVINSTVHPSTSWPVESSENSFQMRPLGITICLHRHKIKSCTKLSGCCTVGLCSSMS